MTTEEDRAHYDTASRQLVKETLEALEKVAAATCGEATYRRLLHARLALYVNVASRGTVAISDVTSETVPDWDTALSYARDGNAHAAAYRAMIEQLVIDHPVMLAHLYAVAFGYDVFAAMERQALDWFDNVRTTPPADVQPTHDANHTRH